MLLIKICPIIFIDDYGVFKYANKSRKFRINYLHFVIKSNHCFRNLITMKNVSVKFSAVVVDMTGYLTFKARIKRIMQEDEDVGNVSAEMCAIVCT